MTKANFINFITGAGGSFIGYSQAATDLGMATPDFDSKTIITAIVTVVSGIVSTLLTNFLKNIFKKSKE